MNTVLNIHSPDHVFTVLVSIIYKAAKENPWGTNSTYLHSYKGVTEQFSTGISASHAIQLQQWCMS